MTGEASEWKQLTLGFVERVVAPVVVVVVVVGLKLFWQTFMHVYLLSKLFDARLFLLSA